MELDRIEKLLEKYFEAETTEAEEQILRDYFTGDSVAEHLQEYSSMFSYFSHAKEERFTKQVPLKPRVDYYKWISVAAVAVMVFGIYFGKDYQEQREAEYAYQQTKKALGLLATNFDRGTKKVAYLNEFQETKQKIYKNN
ncbi:MAG: hypothetical protein HKN52_11865 [Eudoraea sp.]|nr:hypothetical protein [Eudoraea sp.]